MTAEPNSVFLGIYSLRLTPSATNAVVPQGGPDPMARGTMKKINIKKVKKALALSLSMAGANNER